MSLSPQPSAPLKGSWEAVLLEGQRLAGNYNPAAEEPLLKVTQGLGRLPEAMLTARDGYLLSLLLEASNTLIGLYLVLERYGPAKAIAQHLQAKVPFDDRRAVEHQIAEVELMAGELDAALERLRQLAGSGGLDEWGDYFYAALANERYETAAVALKEAEQWYNRHFAKQHTTPEARNHQAYLSGLKARLALAQGKVSEAVAWFEHSAALDKFFAEHANFFYTLLIEAGAPDAALPLVQRDKDTVRRAFWEGLIYLRQGARDRAEQSWRTVAAVPPEEVQTTVLLEHVLCNYYLGDPNGAGLAATLAALQSSETRYWGTFFLAALGWARRNDEEAARHNLGVAVRLRRAMADGRTLDRRFKQFVTDLLPPAQQAWFEPYF